MHRSWQAHALRQRPPVGSTCYIAGPMTGLPNSNYDAFNACAEDLRAEGYIVLNPAENFAGEQGLAWETYLRQGIKQVCDAAFLVLLPGWEFSRGASIEVTVAKTLKIPLVDCGTLGMVWAP